MLSAGVLTALLACLLVVNRLSGVSEPTIGWFWGYMVQLVACIGLFALGAAVSVLVKRSHAFRRNIPSGKRVSVLFGVGWISAAGGAMLADLSLWSGVFGLAVFALPFLVFSWLIRSGRW
jgi:hypothetical protein